MKKYFGKMMLILVFALVLAGCQPNKDTNSTSQANTADSKDNVQVEQKEPSKEETSSQKGEYQKITAEEAKKMMDEQSVIIVDVRTQTEYQSGHIKDALLIPHDSFDKEPPKELDDKNATILLYCRSGNRSQKAAKKLIELGYTNVYDFGGIGDWPYDIVVD